MLHDPLIQSLSVNLHRSAVQQRVIAQNLANSETPHYKAFRVVLDSAMGGEAAGSLPLWRTDPGHLGAPGAGGGLDGVQVTRDTTTSLRNDGNNVDVDRELADLSANTLYYDALSNFTRSAFQGYHRIITGNPG
ncbi:MAG: flagellar basal body rod protein FlgB [bacterium]